MITPANIIVTGGNGRLGKALGAAGCTALGRDAFDITSPPSIEAALRLHKPQIVINAAAYTAVDQAETEIEQAFDINTEGAGNVAALCAARDIPVLNISTDCVFGDGDITRPVREFEPPAALSVYGRTKQEGETRVLDASPMHTSVRVSWLFDDGADTFIGKMLNLAKTRDALSIVDDEWGRPTPVGDLCDMLFKIAAARLKGDPVPQILHVGPAQAVSRLEWAQHIFATSARLGGPAPKLSAISASAFKTPARRPRKLILSVDEATQRFGEMPSWHTASDKVIQSILMDAY